MAHGHKLVQHALPINADALSTLAARTAIIVNTLMVNITNSFLMKQFRYILQLTGRTLSDDGPISIGLAHGDATVAEIATAMQESNTRGPDDVTQTLTETNTWAVYQNTVRTFVYRGDGTEAVLATGWLPMGGKNGIPAKEDSGFVVFVFNHGSGALTDGQVVNGQVFVRGVWMRE